MASLEVLRPSASSRSWHYCTLVRQMSSGKTAKRSCIYTCKKTYIIYTHIYVHMYNVPKYPQNNHQTRKGCLFGTYFYTHEPTKALPPKKTNTGIFFVALVSVSYVLAGGAECIRLDQFSTMTPKPTLSLRLSLRVQCVLPQGLQMYPHTHARARAA